MKTADLLLGLMLGVISGLLSGSSGAFLKKIKVWAWENIWLAYSIWALLFLPAMLAWATVPRLPQVLSAAPLDTLIAVFLCGIGWGCATVGFALGIRDIGLALTSVIVIGLGNAAGTLFPLLLDQPGSLIRPAGLTICGGVLLTVCGIILCSGAALRTEKSLAPRAPDAQDAQDMPHQDVRVKGILICVLSGLLSILFNLGLIFGKPLAQEAALAGAAPQYAANAAWLILLGGGFSVMIGYCLYRVVKQKSQPLFWLPGTGINWLHIGGMGLVWLAGVLFYGMSVTRLGRLGPAIGWPIFQCIQIAAANFWGAATGEWRGADRMARRMRRAGLILLFGGIAVIGWAGKL